MKTTKEIVAGRIEPLEPQDTILSVLKENDGKRLDKRLIEKLKAATKDDTINLDLRAGMAHIQWGGYGNNCKGSLLAQYAVKNLRVDAAWIEENNAAYYRAARERNARRAETLKNEDLLTKADVAIEQYIAAREHLETLLKEFPHDHYELERVAGLRD